MSWTKETVARLNGEGKTVREIGEYVGLSNSSVYRILSGLGLAPNIKAPCRAPRLPGTGQGEYHPPVERNRATSPRCPVRAGDTLTFLPSAWEHFSGAGPWGGEMRGVLRQARGMVEAVHEEHRWYCVRYEANGYTMREGFKF